MCGAEVKIYASLSRLSSKRRYRTDISSSKPASPGQYGMYAILQLVNESFHQNSVSEMACTQAPWQVRLCTL